MFHILIALTGGASLYFAPYLLAMSGMSVGLMKTYAMKTMSKSSGSPVPNTVNLRGNHIFQTHEEQARRGKKSAAVVGSVPVVRLPKISGVYPQGIHASGPDQERRN